MNDTVVVTGLMRSGTSLAACILHRLGWFAGMYLSPPFPPSWRSDWEDPWSVDLILGEKIRPRFFKDWVLSKRSSGSAVGFARSLFKSPYLALYMPQLLAATPNPFVIVTKRDAGEVRASMARHPQCSEEDQGRIGLALASIKADYIFDTDRCQEDPRTEIQNMCMAIGFDPGSDLEDAISLVDQKKAQVF